MTSLFRNFKALGQGTVEQHECERDPSFGTPGKSFVVYDRRRAQLSRDSHPDVHDVANSFTEMEPLLARLGMEQ